MTGQGDGSAGGQSAGYGQPALSAAALAALAVLGVLAFLAVLGASSLRWVHA